MLLNKASRIVCSSTGKLYAGGSLNVFGAKKNIFETSKGKKE